MSSVSLVVDRPKYHYEDDSYGFDMEMADAYCVLDAACSLARKL